MIFIQSKNYHKALLLFLQVTPFIFNFPYCLARNLDDALVKDVISSNDNIMFKVRRKCSLIRHIVKTSIFWLCHDK